MLNFKTKYLSKSKYFILDKKICLKKPLTWNRQFSSKWGVYFMQLCVLGICEAIFRGRHLIFCVEPHINIYFTDIQYFFYLDTLEPAPGRPAPELEVKDRKIVKLDVLEQAPGCQNKKNYLISVKYILIWGSTQKIRSLPLKMASKIPQNVHEIPPPSLTTKLTISST